MTQRQAYYNTIVAVMKENEVTFEESVTVCRTVFTTEMRAQVIAIVMTGFKDKTIPLKDTPSNQEKLANDDKLKEYSISTLNNWFLKDERLNGGVKHEIKNKGIRAGQGDKHVRNFKALLTQFEPGTEKYKTIQKRIEDRKEVIRQEKANKTTKEVNYDLIPDDLREELGL